MNVPPITLPCPACGAELRVPIDVIEESRPCDREAIVVELQPDLTEITKHDCATADERAAMRSILNAWTVPGPAPRVHRAAQDRLRRDWPTLAHALDRATKETP